MERIRSPAEEEVCDRTEEVDAYDRGPQPLAATNLPATTSRKIEPRGQSHCHLNSAENDDAAAAAFAYAFLGFGFDFLTSCIVLLRTCRQPRWIAWCVHSRTRTGS